MDETVLQQPQKFTFPNDPVSTSVPSPGGNVSEAAQSSAFAFPANTPAGPTLIDSNSLNTQPHAISPTSVQPSSSQSAKSFHKRSRTSVNKLPAFTFNPGASANSHESATASAAASPEPLFPESPIRGGRHRRSTSELVGGQGGLKGSIFPPMKVDFGLPPEDVLVDSGDFPTQRGHRPPLSETIVAQPTPSSVRLLPPTLPQPNEPPPRPLDDRVVDDAALESTPLPSITQPDSQAHVGFADDVEVIPRPLSEASDESEGSVDTLKEALLSEAGSSSDDAPLRSRLNAQEAIVMHGDNKDSSEGSVAYNFSGSRYTDTPETQDITLDENFDGDPTSAVIFDGGAERTAFSTESSVPGEQKSQWTAEEPGAGAIDLDLALADDYSAQDLRSSQIRNFQSARRSMHSSAAMSGFLGPGAHYHRRAESAPLLASINFDRHFDGSASNKGFEIQDVFEEDEEDAAPSETQPQVSSKPSTHEESVGGLGIASGNKYSDGSMAPPVAPVKSFGNRPIRRSGKHDEEHALTLPQAPFMTPDTASSSSFSSPKGQGSSEPSIQFRQSVDDVPSLMSSASTVGSGALSNYAPGSSDSPAPGSSASTTDITKNAERRRKRSSVVSLSRLIGGSYGGSERRLADAGYDKRCQSSDGLASTRTTKGQRLSRLLKFWKVKDAERR